MVTATIAPNRDINAPGPSTSPPLTSIVMPIKKKPSAPKRKRDESQVSATASLEDGTGNQALSAKEKKKKANRACFHCQKAHLTCDDTRPCQRCIKRGMGDNCTEGHRKKAKYLLDEEELDALKRAKETKANVNGQSDKQSEKAPTQKPSQIPEQSPVLPTPVIANDSPDFDPLFNMSYDPSYPFGSQAANMEYSILSAILGNPSSEDGAFSPPSPPPSTTMTTFPTSLPLSNNSWPAIVQNQLTGANLSNNQTFLQSLNGLDSMDILNSPYGHPSSPELNKQHRLSSSTSNFLRPNALAPPTPPASDPSPQSPSIMNTDSPDMVTGTAGNGDVSQQVRSFNQTSNGTAAENAISTLQLQAFGTSKQALAIQHQRTANVYSSVTKPYDYVDGYHYLMQYLHGRFEKNDILRIVRALAIYRPSLIALQMPLSVEDEVFVEKSFQRTMIELEKLISFSGTPTVVWRRTGEICLVGLEFTMLSEWSTEDLIGKRKFIYELFDHQSVVEYWEKFASHAFEASSQSVYSHCVLLKPSGAPVPCAFCFSIRRDVFDLPSVVIGQWLPLL